MPPVLLGVDGFPRGVPSDYGIATLGPGVLQWGADNLVQPDGDDAGGPWCWSRLQARFILWWYALDGTGRQLYDRSQLVLPKGSGKSPFAGALSAGELGGPVVFDGFDAAGRAVGRPHASPWVQLAAVSEDQTVNTMSIVIAMLQDADIPGLDPGLTRIYTANGRLEPVTASAPSREGQRLTAAVLDEPHLWLPSNGGKRLAATIRRNLAKMGGRSIETTNAWRDGEDSVAERTSFAADLAAEGRTKTARILRMHPKGVVPDLADEAALRAALVTLYADAPWIDVDRIISEIYDPDTEPGDARRFYLNEITSADDALVTAGEYDACRDGEPLADGDVITLGLDGGKSDDATALIACRVSDRLFQPLDLGDGMLSIWEPPVRRAHRSLAATTMWELDRTLVDEAVHRAFKQYRVVGFFADVEHFESYIDAWANKYRGRLKVKASTASAIGWDMRGRVQVSTLANERLMRAIRDGAIMHTGESTQRRHVLNARRRPNRWGTSFGKESRESVNKVDAYAGMLLADMARHDLLERGYRPPASSRGRIIVLD
jgi:hypothetical protein